MLKPVGRREERNGTAVTRQADPFCTGNEQRSFRLLGFSLVATERTTTFSLNFDCFHAIFIFFYAFGQFCGTLVNPSV